MLTPCVRTLCARTHLLKDFGHVPALSSGAPSGHGNLIMMKGNMNGKGASMSERNTAFYSTCVVHGCQMAIARFLDRMCLALRASGLWLRYATVQNLIPSFPFLGLRQGGGRGGAIQGKEGIKFCSVA